MAQVSTQAPILLHPPSKRRRFWVIGTIALVVLAVALAAAVAARRSVPAVAVAHPQSITIRETIAGNGTVFGVHETLVGSQVSGVVQQLKVREGDQVSSGQTIAVVNDRVIQAQVAQAEAALNTARAQLTRTARPPLSSDVRAASEQLSQALAQAEQQRAAIRQARSAQNQARAQLNQSNAERALAEKQFHRSEVLFKQGYISRAEFDNVQTQVRIANERVATQAGAVQSAAANTQAMQENLRGAEANAAAQHARLDTLLAGALPEDINVARNRVVEAEQSLRAARRQAENTVIRAPFSGTIAAINAEVGQSVGASGVAQLVSRRLEIRFDVDEFDLGQLARGQMTAISSSAFPGAVFSGRVIRIGSAVDSQRGTVTVTVSPDAPPSWLRAGQTVNVEILTANAAHRLLVPSTAIARIGDRTVVYVVKNGQAVERSVIVRPATERGVPVVSGLHASDRVILNAPGMEAGKRVREAYASR